MTQLSEDQIALPSQISRPEGALMIWTLYDHPRDYPSGYVLRPTAVLAGVTLFSPIVWYASTPEELEAILPDGVIRMGPQEGDDPVILSVWME